MSEANPTHVEATERSAPGAAYHPPHWPPANGAAEQQTSHVYAWLERARRAAGMRADLARLGLLTAVYVLVGKLGLQLASVHPSATAVWPATGLALAALLVLGARVWPGIMLGSFLVNLTTAGSLASSLGIASGNTLEALVGAALVNRFAHGCRAFEHPQDILLFALLILGPSTMLSATVGVTSLALAGFAPWARYGAIWLTWWLGNAMGALIFTPLLLTWTANRRWGWTGAQMLEGVLLLAALGVVGQFVFTGWSAAGMRHLPLGFLCLPLLLLIAVRFSQREAATAVALLSGIAIWGTLQGFGPFVRAVPNESLLLLQAFMGTMALTSMLLGAAVAARQEADAARTAAHAQAQAVLEQQQREQAGREEEFRTVLEINKTLGQVRELPTLLNAIAEEAARLLAVPWVTFRLRDGKALPVVGAWTRPETVMTTSTVQVGESLSGWVVAAGEPLVVNDITLDERPAPEPRARMVQLGYTAFLGVPLRLGDEVIGMMAFRAEHTRPFTGHDRALALALADQAAIAVQHARLYTQAERRRQIAESLTEISSRLAQSLHAAEVGQEIVESVRALLQAHAAVLFRQEPDSKALTVLASTDSAGPFAPAQTLPPATGLVGLAIRDGRTLVTSNFLTDPRVQFPPEVLAVLRQTPYRVVLAVPLIRHARAIGALSIVDLEGRSFTEEEIQVAQTFADQAATALENARLFEEVQTGHERLQALSHQLLEVQENERRRLAGELHDEIGQLLTAVQLNLEAGQRSTATPGPRRFFRDSIAAIQHVQQQVCTLALELRPSMLDYLGLVPALRWYVDQQSQRSGVLMRLMAASPELRAPPHLETVCFRVVQEALTNVMRHAQAHQVFIDLQQDDGALALSIRDDGVGFDVAAAQTRARQGGSVGILGMQERVQLAGGHLEIVSAAAQGTTLQVHLPLSLPGA